MKIKKIDFLISATFILIGTIGAAALYWYPNYWKSVVGLEFLSNEKIWQSFSWRARLCLQKAEGGVPRALMDRTLGADAPRKPGHWIKGRSVKGSLVYSSTASEGDRAAGACIFRKRCTGCHGGDGSGGLHGPSLNRSGYKHGDSDLAIYKVLRDGVPGTLCPVPICRHGSCCRSLPMSERYRYINLKISGPKGLAWLSR